MYAVVLNSHFNGLSIIQELGRRGVDVRALDSSYTIGSVSRFAKFSICPDPAKNEVGLISFLLEYGAKQKGRGILFPTNDHWAKAVAHHQEKLNQFFEVCAPTASVIDLVLEKHRFCEWAKSFKFPVPHTWRLADRRLIPSGAFPLVGKPEYRRTSISGSDSRSLHSYLDKFRLEIINNLGDLDHFHKKHSSYESHFILQRFIRGLSDNMFTVGVYVDKRSNVRGLFTGRKVRGFPPDYGDCILGQSETVPVALKKVVFDVCKQLGYSGIAEFEFKRDAITGEFFLIEINPRSWSWIGITPAAGVSLPWLAFQDLSKKEIPPLVESKVQNGAVKYVKILQDFDNCLWRNKLAGYPAWDFSIWDWVRSLRAECLVIAEYSLDDLKPSLYAGCFYLLTKAKRLFEWCQKKWSWPKVGKSV